MPGISDALYLLTETRALVNRALLGFVVFLVVYKFLLPQLFRALKVDTVLVMTLLYLLLRISLRGGPALGW